jgi:hypothetical protein
LLSELLPKIDLGLKLPGPNLFNNKGGGGDSKGGKPEPPKPSEGKPGGGAWEGAGAPSGREMTGKAVEATRRPDDPAGSARGLAGVVGADAATAKRLENEYRKAAAGLPAGATQADKNRAYEQAARRAVPDIDRRLESGPAGAALRRAADDHARKAAEAQKAGGNPRQAVIDAVLNGLTEAERRALDKHLGDAGDPATLARRAALFAWGLHLEATAENPGNKK